MRALDVEAVRRRFPALARQVGSRPAVFFDGPAGSQVPREVLDAMSAYLTHSNANCGGLFATSVESDALLERAHAAAADLLGADDGRAVVFGPNMTTLTWALSRSLARTWKAGDEIVVTRLEHDANYTPWVQAAQHAGVVVRSSGIHIEDCTLDLNDLERQVTPRTRLVAVGAASNAVGTVNPVREIVELAHAVDARVFVDAVHFAPHRAIDVAAWGCDFLACSAYKFFGPHVGILWGRGDLLDTLPVEKLRPVEDRAPARWMPGTQNHEGIAGTLAAIDYLAGLGRERSATRGDRRAALLEAFRAIEAHETTLVERLLAGLGGIRGVRVHGITDAGRMAQRVPTVGLTVAGRSPTEVAAALAERGIFVWQGNFYALPLTEALGLEPEGLVRIGLLHYNTSAEVDRLLETLLQCV